MNVPSNPPIPPLGSYGGAQPPPAPAPTPGASQSTPIPVFAGEKDPSANSAESLLNRLITPLLPQQLSPQGAESFLNPARIFALLTQGMMKPKNENSAPEASKTVMSQRDETGGKGDSGKGADIVKIQVFKPEETGKGSQKEKFSSGETSSDKGQTAVGTNPKEGMTKSESKALMSDNREKPIQGGKEAKTSGNETLNSPPKGAPEETQTKTALPLEKNQESQKGDNLQKSEKSLPASNESKLKDSAETKPAESNSPKPLENKPEVQNQKGSPEKFANEANKSVVERQIVQPDPSSIETQFDRHQETVQQPIVNKPKDSPDQIAEKIKDKEKLETEQRDDKYQNIEHSAGHRVLEHGNAGNRREFAAFQAGEGRGLSQVIDTNKAIPPWIAALFQAQQEQKKLANKGKSGGNKQVNELIEYRLSDVLFMLAAAAVCSCKSIADYVNFIQSREKLFTVILGGQCNLPPRELIWRILSSLNPVNFQHFLSPWLEEICGRPSRLKDHEGKPVLPAISVWQSPIGLIMGQAKGADPFQDRLAIPYLLQLFNLRGGLVAARSASHKIDVPALIEKVKADFLVEISVDNSAVDEIQTLIESAAKTKSHLYSHFESYVEGQDRIIVEAFQIDKSYKLPSYQTHASATQILKIFAETVASGTTTYKNLYFLSNVDSLEDEIFDLLRLQKPLERKTAWCLNCLFPAVPMSFAMQQCQQNILLLRQFAIGLLQRSSGDLTLDEKMQLAASNIDELLNFLRT